MTQDDMVLQYIYDFGSITTWEAFTEFGITRLSARIYNLRNAGHNIQKKFESTKNRYGKKVNYCRYYIEK